ncbi:hypothetical protein GCM10010216_69360 [Streptomyces flaveolus]|nr:hypothetical protein GCM10010216_69360 [Streptomyces flaveolus]
MAIRPSNGPSSRGATVIGTNVLLTTSFQYATFSWSGTEAVVNTMLKLLSAQEMSGGCEGREQVGTAASLRKTAAGTRQGRMCPRTGSGLAGAQPCRFGEARFLPARNSQAAVG